MQKISKIEVNLVNVGDDFDYFFLLDGSFIGKVKSTKVEKNIPVYSNGNTGVIVPLPPEAIEKSKKEEKMKNTKDIIDEVKDSYKQ